MKDECPSIGFIPEATQDPQVSDWQDQSTVWPIDDNLSSMPLIRPRLTEYHGIFKPQSELDFAIPILDEDIPLYVDPFLLWKSPSQQDKALHLSILNIFNRIGHLARTNRDKAIEHLVVMSECDEVGMGLSAHGTGKRIGKGQAAQIVQLFEAVPQYQQNGFRHFEKKSNFSSTAFPRTGSAISLAT